MEIRFDDDLDLRRIAESGQCFRWKSIGDEGVYRVIAGGKVLFLKQKAGNILDLSCNEKDLKAFWENYLDFGTDYRSIRKLVRKDDPYLSEAARNGEGIRILCQDPFEALISFIISQRKSIPAISSSIEKLCKKAGKKITLSKGEITWLKKHALSSEGEDDLYSFPSPSDIAGLSTDDLNACSLGYRVPYVRSAAEAVLLGDADLDRMRSLSDEELMEELMKLCGVGKKVASCTALFGFHRLDFFPIDVWIERILSEHYRKGFPYDSYRPFNGVMQQYLFYSKR